MDQETIQLCDDPDDDFRSAAQWILRLKQQNVHSTTLRAFVDWLEESPDHRRSLVRCEALWEIVRRSTEVHREAHAPRRCSGTFLSHFGARRAEARAGLAPYLPSYAQVVVP